MVLDQSKKRPKRIVGSHRQLHWKHDKENRHSVKAENACAVGAGNCSDGVPTLDEGAASASSKIEEIRRWGQRRYSWPRDFPPSPEINRRLSPEFRS